MQLEIGLTTFYSKGDEQRFFQGLTDISAIKEIRGIGKELVVQLDTRSLSKEALRELIAVLWRYGISLYPLRVLAENRKFAWIAEEKFYWHKNMFGVPVKQTRASPIGRKNPRKAHSVGR